MTFMTKLTFAVGSALILTGLVTLALTRTSVTALIPAFVGIPILLCAIAATRPKLHKIAVHIALVIALIGLFGSLMNTTKLGAVFAGTAERPAAIIESAIMTVLTLIYLVFGIRSFIAARRGRAVMGPGGQD